ncbi:hypothetical protein BABINDRAFT_163320 [Babjeviella inositovora NRRL Y-12698]|uniref:RRM domain-containing protein n=1 Tax=Babjeviella inositovora NRRL Y-12698 TaxID=984486 RepID=A0A1E3QIR6_9ASCO|nr:uncharacterized protein BABINDRAFT_163320 [Babjeviella inositovora NRRL Y-12698]ODQ77589.1 hypothetical protein BABINDRAFT_163320 [Babjeviella inositovora NRRL Y-12698]
MATFEIAMPEIDSLEIVSDPNSPDSDELYVTTFDDKYDNVDGDYLIRQGNHVVDVVVTYERTCDTLGETNSEEFKDFIRGLVLNGYPSLQVLPTEENVGGENRIYFEAKSVSYATSKSFNGPKLEAELQMQSGMKFPMRSFKLGSVLDSALDSVSTPRLVSSLASTSISVPSPGPSSDLVSPSGLTPVVHENAIFRLGSSSDAQALRTAISANHPSVSVYFEYPESLSHPGNVFVRGLSLLATEADLYRVLAPYGQINNVNVIVKLERHRFGFVKFNSHESAINAIKALNGTKVFGETDFFVNPYLSKRERTHAQQQLDAIHQLNEYRDLYVVGIPENVHLNELLTLFNRLYLVENSYIPKTPLQEDMAPTTNPIPNTTPHNCGTAPRNFAFIRYATNKQALSTLLALNQHEILPGSRLCIQIAQVKHILAHQDAIPYPQFKFLMASCSPDFQETNLYVKNLPLEVDDMLFHAMFRPHGEIVSAKIITKPARGSGENTGSKGYGFVCFKTRELTIAALLNLNGKLVNGNKIHVSFAQVNQRKGRGTQAVQVQTFTPPAYPHFGNYYPGMIHPNFMVPGSGHIPPPPVLCPADGMYLPVYYPEMIYSYSPDMPYMPQEEYFGQFPMRYSPEGMNGYQWKGGYQRGSGVMRREPKEK